MTPTERDIEEVLLKKIKVIGEQEHSYYGYPAELIGLLADFITADRKRVALEARIDENEAWYALGRRIDPREFVAEIGRLELKKQEEV